MGLRLRGKGSWRSKAAWLLAPRTGARHLADNAPYASTLLCTSQAADHECLHSPLSPCTISMATPCVPCACMHDSLPCTSSATSAAPASALLMSANRNSGAVSVHAVLPCLTALHCKLQARRVTTPGQQQRNNMLALRLHIARLHSAMLRPVNSPCAASSAAWPSPQPFRRCNHALPTEVRAAARYIYYIVRAKRR